MKTKLGMLALGLIAGGTLFAQPRVSIGIGVGGYGPPPAYAQYRPACPGPGYVWADGYWRRASVAPRYVEPRIYNSYRDNDHRYRGEERREDRHDDRGRGYSNSFRR